VMLGAVAGLIATVPMTIVMLKWHKHLPARQRYALPPRLITDRIAARTPLPNGLIPPPGTKRTLLAHFAFGAAAGSIFAVGQTQAGNRNSASLSIGYGLLVWAVSYLGWVPAARLMPPATRQPAARNMMMIAAHIVWGASLGLALSTLEGRGTRANISR